MARRKTSTQARPETTEVWWKILPVWVLNLVTSEGNGSFCLHRECGLWAGVYTGTWQCDLPNRFRREENFIQLSSSREPSSNLQVKNEFTKVSSFSSGLLFMSLDWRLAIFWGSGHPGVCIYLCLMWICLTGRRGLKTSFLLQMRVKHTLGWKEFVLIPLSTKFLAESLGGETRIQCEENWKGIWNNKLFRPVVWKIW